MGQSIRLRGLKSWFGFDIYFDFDLALHAPRKAFLQLHRKIMLPLNILPEYFKGCFHASSKTGRRHHLFYFFLPGGKLHST